MSENEPRDPQSESDQRDSVDAGSDATERETTGFPGAAQDDSEQDPPEPWAPRSQNALEPPLPPYPGPLSATLLTLGAFAALVFVTSLFVTESFAASIGLGQAIGMGAVATLAARRVAEPRAERLGLQGFDLQFISPLILLLAASLLLSEFDNLLTGWFPPPELSAEEEKLLSSLNFDSVYGQLQLFIILVGIKPVVEELLFRGVIQQGLIEHIGRWRGVALTAFLFAPIYAVLARTGTSFASALSVAFCAGILFGIVRLATGSVLAPMLLSGGFNALALAAGWFEAEIPIAGYNAPGEHTPILVLMLAATAVAYALVPLARLAAAAPVAIPRPGASQERASSRE